MIQDIQQISEFSEKWRDINYVKKLVDEIYHNQIISSLGLHTLELTRRFNNSYRLFKEKRNLQAFRELCIMAGNLEQKLQKEELTL